jgi:hypothetical protein
VVGGNSWTDNEKLMELQRSIHDTVDKNREIYQLKTFQEYDTNNGTASKQLFPSDTDDSDDELAELDLTMGNKDACVLEVDDIQDLEVISHLMEGCPPDGFHVVNTQAVPGLHDLEVVKNLQMFTQIWRAKLSLTHGSKNFSRHFQRLLQTIYFKLRTMMPCAICDLRFRLDFPEAVSERRWGQCGGGWNHGDSKPTKFFSKIDKKTRKSLFSEVKFTVSSIIGAKNQFGRHFEFFRRAFFQEKVNLQKRQYLKKRILNFLPHFSLILKLQNFEKIRKLFLQVFKMAVIRKFAKFYIK